MPRSGPGLQLRLSTAEPGPLQLADPPESTPVPATWPNLVFGALPMCWHS